MNFELKDSSPCIDAGDPASPPDPDGSPADMGAYFSYQEPQETAVMINEINYYSHPDHNAGDWVEIYNSTGLDQVLSGWVFKDSQDEHTYRFPENFKLGKDEYLVLCNNIDSFMTEYPMVWNYRGPFEFGLKRDDETLRLFDAQMNLVDLVEYTNEDPWPEEPDGSGYTLQLIGSWLDNNKAESWQASNEMFGNPGSENFLSAVYEVEKNAQLRVFPNPTAGILYVSLEGLSTSRACIEVIDLKGTLASKHEFNPGAEGSVVLLDLALLPKGVYALKLTSGKNFFTTKLILR